MRLECRSLCWSRDRVAEGAPLLREYVGKTCIEGSNPSVSASKNIKAHDSVGFFVFNALLTIKTTID